MSKMTENPRRCGVGGPSGDAGSGGAFIPLSPPKCEVDDTPLHGKTLNKNKESLKVKLMLRRPREDLVSRGVIPPMNTPMAFYEQRQKLDMAKKHDILKHKMQRRPLREELVRQHILEDSPGNIDPSLVEKQKQLKRARIADTISDHLCQRPGPLELVKANILHTSEDLEKAVKEGQLMFKSTCEGEPRKHPSLYIYDDESSSEGGMSPEQVDGGSGRASTDTFASQSVSAFPTLLPITASAAVPTATLIPVSSNTISATFVTTAPITSTTLFSSCPISDVPSSPLTSNTSSLSPLSSLASPQHNFMSSPQTPITQTLLVTQTTLPQALTTPPQQNCAPGKDPSKSRKKSKGKMQPKTRTIKFHEYKGPPSAAKRDHSHTTETSYDILLQQQQLFLQCQLELKQKYTQIILPASLKTASNDLNPGVTLSSVLALASPSSVISSNTSSPSLALANTGNPPIAPAPPSHSSNNPPVPPPPPTPPTPYKLPVKLEDLKVSDLKLELKKRNLPVSGSKPQLIERLKFHSKLSFSTASVKSSINNSNNNNNNNINNNINNTAINSSCSSTIATTFNTSKIITGNRNSESFSSPERHTPSPVVCVYSNSNAIGKEISQGGGIGCDMKRPSLDITDDTSVVGMFESSMEVGEDSVLSPAYSQISSTRPSSVAPMDVDFDSAMDGSNFGPMTPVNHSSSVGVLGTESGSINTPPPPPPPPPPPLPLANSVFKSEMDAVSNKTPEVMNLLSCLEASCHGSSDNQDGINRLKKKIEELQRELLNTQMQLQQQQKQNMLKAKENYKKNIIDPKFNQKAILQHQIDSKKHQQQQQQLHSHLLLLQQNLHNEQKELEKNSGHDALKDLDDLILISPDSTGLYSNAHIEPQHQKHFIDEHLYNNEIEQRYQTSHQQRHSSPPPPPPPPPPLSQKQKHIQFITPISNKQVIHEAGDMHLKLDGSWDQFGSDKNTRSMYLPNGIIISAHHRASSLPNFAGFIIPNESQSSQTIEVPINSSISNTFTYSTISSTPLKSPSTASTLKSSNQFHAPETLELNLKPPPNYTEATQQSKIYEHFRHNTPNELSRKQSYKSQQVDDVLEILIKNGELPPSAAQDPITPSTPQRENEPFFLSIGPSENSPSIPPPPPPPPPPSSSYKGLSASNNNNNSSNNSWVPTSCTTSSSFATISSPSLFAGLVMEGSSPANLDLQLDLDLPVFEGMELGSMETHSSALPQELLKVESKDSGAFTDMKMEVGDDVDVSSWLDSLAPSQNSHSSHATIPSVWMDDSAVLVTHSLYKTPDSATSSGVSSMRSSSSASSSTSSSSCALNLNQSDPLLGSNPDQMDLFCIEDVDLRPPHESSNLSWDRLDFPT